MNLADPDLPHHERRNLARIVQTDGLWCDAERVRQGFDCVGIAHERLKERRARTPVRNRAGQTVAAGGVLADYVPFYFANRSPMLYSIHGATSWGMLEGRRMSFTSSAASSESWPATVLGASPTVTPSRR